VQIECSAGCTSRAGAEVERMLQRCKAVQGEQYGDAQVLVSRGIVGAEQFY
jgi:hypothetical protein